MDEIEINGTYIDILVFVTKMLVNALYGRGEGGGELSLFWE
jgi:hypothetical protein